MTYKKDSPISQDTWRQRTTQPYIPAHDLCAPRAASPAPLRASIDFTLYISSTNALQDSSAILTSNNSVFEPNSTTIMTSTLAQSQLASSSSSIEGDDDYDSCFDSDDATATFPINNDWLHEEEEVHEEDFESDSDSDTDLDASGNFNESIHTSDASSRSFDSASANGILHDLPHWWGEEDCEHTKAVLDHYIATVGIDIERKKLLRASPPFVGRVVRHQVPSVDSLQSIDEVFVFRYEILPFGQTMPLIRTHWVMSIWDEDSGLPSSQVLLSPMVANAVWLPLARSNLVSQLICEPDASSPSQFICSSSVERRPLRRSNESASSSLDTTLHPVLIGYHKACLSWSRFFPECSSSRAFGNDSCAD